VGLVNLGLVVDLVSNEQDNEDGESDIDLREERKREGGRGN